MSGDLYQHAPVTGHPLYYGASLTSDMAVRWAAEKPTAKAGRDVWLQFSTVFFLEGQHRLKRDDEDGQQLYRFSRFYNRDSNPPSREEVELMCDSLQQAALQHAADIQADLPAFAARNPHVVVTRNTVRTVLNSKLVMLQARHQQKRLIVWRSQDTVDNQPGLVSLTPELENSLLAVPANKTGEICAVNYFFEGMEYVFVDSQHPVVGRMKNNTCVGVRLILHPNEPEDDLSKPYRALKYLPLAVYVKPTMENGPAFNLFDDPVLEGCIPVKPSVAMFTFTLPGPMQVGGHTITSLRIRRVGLPLGEGYAVTDYYCQGLSFREKYWLAHLTPPSDGGGIKRASLFVIKSRFRAWSAVIPVAPLWDPHASNAASERERVIDAYWQAARMSGVEVHLAAELQRLRALAAATNVPQLTA